MHVRTATERDFAGIDALLVASYTKLMAAAYDAAVLSVALPAMTKAQPKLIASKRFYVVQSGADIVGCGGWSLEAPGSGERTEGLAHIRHFASDPNALGRGIGRSLFETCALDARASGMVKLQALSSLNAEPFYARMGLQSLRRIEIPMGSVGAFPVVLMEGPL